MGNVAIATNLKNCKSLIPLLKDKMLIELKKYLSKSLDIIYTDKETIAKKVTVVVLGYNSLPNEER